MASSVEWATESLTISRESSDASGEAFAHYVLGWVDLQLRQDYQSAREHLESSLAIYQSSRDVWGLARIYYNLGSLAAFQGDPVTQRFYLEKSMVVCREAGDLRGMAVALDNLAQVIAFQGDLRGGCKMVEEAIRIYRQLGATGSMGGALIVYGDILCWRGDYAGAREIFEEALEKSNQSGNAIYILTSRIYLAYLARLEGEFQQAARTIEACLSQVEEYGSQASFLLSYAYVELARAQMGMGELARAKDLIEESLANVTPPFERVGALLGSGLLAILQGNGELAAAVLQQCLLAYKGLQYRIGFIPALEGYAGALQLLFRPEDATCILGAAAAYRQQIGAPIAPGDKPRYDRLYADLLAQLGEPAFAQAWERGQAMAIDDAVATILEEIVDQFQSTKFRIHPAVPSTSPRGSGKGEVYVRARQKKEPPN